MPKTPKTAKTPAELFHSYLVDSRCPQINKSRITTFENQRSTDLRLFASDLDDPRRTNMEVACSLPGDDHFYINGFKLETKFSSSVVVADFIRSTWFTVWIGDKSVYTLEANVLADRNIREGFTLPGGVTQGPEDLNTHLTASQELCIPILIAPRQSIEVVMSTSGMVAERFQRIESGLEHAFVEVRFTLCGDRVTRIKGDDPDYFPSKEGMVLTSYPKDQPPSPDGPSVHPILPLMDCTTTSPYRGHGKPNEKSPLSRFSENLMVHLKTLTNKGKLTPELVKQALRNSIDTFYEYQNELGYFTIPPEDTTCGSDDGFDTELVYGAPFAKGQEMTEAEIAFFKNTPPVQENEIEPWNPLDYLQKKPPNG
jgi:hypothetical protein